MTWEAGMLSLHQSPKYFNQTRRLELYSSQGYLYSTVAQIFGSILHLISAFLGVSAFSLPPSAVASRGKQAFRGTCVAHYGKRHWRSQQAPGRQHWFTWREQNTHSLQCTWGTVLLSAAVAIYFPTLMSSVLTVKWQIRWGQSRRPWHDTVIKNKLVHSSIITGHINTSFTYMFLNLKFTDLNPA